MKTFLLALVCVTAAYAQQLALSITDPNNGQIRPGSTLTINVQLSGAAGRNIAAWQATLKSTTGGAFTATAGPAGTAAGKTMACASVSGDFNCIEYGVNSNVITDGSVATYKLDIPANATPGQVSITVSNLLAASEAGDAVPLTSNPLNFVLASPLSKCDLNSDGATNAQDVVLMVNQILGLAPCSADLDNDGQCRVPDLVRVVNASLTGSCRVAQ